MISGVRCGARWQQGSVTIKQSAMIDTLTKSFNVTAQSDIPASTVADLGPTTADDAMVDCPFRQVVGGVMWLAGMTRPDIANAARAVACYSHKPCERYWKAAVKILAIPKFNAGFRDNVQERGGAIAVGLHRC